MLKVCAIPQLVQDQAESWTTHNLFAPVCEVCENGKSSECKTSSRTKLMHVYSLGSYDNKSIQIHLSWGSIANTTPQWRGSFEGETNSRW